MWTAEYTGKRTVSTEFLWSCKESHKCGSGMTNVALSILWGSGHYFEMILPERFWIKEIFKQKTLQMVGLNIVLLGLLLLVFSFIWCYSSWTKSIFLLFQKFINLSLGSYLSCLKLNLYVQDDCYWITGMRVNREGSKENYLLWHCQR